MYHVAKKSLIVVYLANAGTRGSWRARHRSLGTFESQSNYACPHDLYLIANSKFLFSVHPIDRCGACCGLHFVSQRYSRFPVEFPWD